MEIYRLDDIQLFFVQPCPDSWLPDEFATMDRGSDVTLYSNGGNLRWESIGADGLAFNSYVFWVDEKINPKYRSREGSILTDRSSPSSNRNALSTGLALDRSEFTLDQSESAHRV
jgi:hypothetical protein